MTTTPETIATALGVTAPDPGSIQEQQWQLWIDDATMLIETRAAQLNISTAEIGEAKLDYVIREAVVAHAKHPEDATQVSTTIDDSTVSRSYRSGRGRVTIIDEWWIMLGLTAPDSAFTIDPAPASHPLAPVRAFLTAAGI